jgi:hypothetical protein
MPMSIRLVCGTLLMCGSTWGPAGPAAAAEDAVRCDCWYGGYDDYTQDQGGIDFCNDPPPGTKLDECELIHTPQTPAKEWWRDGCVAAVEGEGRKCPYKA